MLSGIQIILTLSFAILSIASEVQGSSPPFATFTYETLEKFIFLCPSVHILSNNFMRLKSVYLQKVIRII